MEDILREFQRTSDPAYLHTVSMNELYRNVYQSRPPIIDGLLYPGTYLFAGAPKVGKSFLMAQLAYHVSMGLPLWGYPVHKGTVLYLALEDDHRRLQGRLYRMFGMDGTNDLLFAIYAKQLGLGLEEQGPDTFIGHAFVPCPGSGFFQEVLTVLPLFPGFFQLFFQGSGLAFALEPVAQGLPAGFGLFRRYGLFGQAGDGFPGLVEGLFFCFLFLPHLVPAPFSFACRLAAPFFFQAVVPVGAGFFLQARQLDPFFAGCLIAALAGRKGRQLPLGFSQVLLSLLGQLTGFFSRLKGLFTLFFQVIEMTARFGQDFRLAQDGDGVPLFLELAGLVLELRRFPALLVPQEPVIFQGLGGLEGRLAGLAPGFSLAPLCIDGGAFILPGFLFIRQLFFAGDAQVVQALFPPLAARVSWRALASSWSRA